MFKDVDIKFVNKEITPFGGLSLFFKMLEKCGYDKVLQECGLPEQGSNRGYKPWQLVMGLFAGVWCGACKFGHLDLVRYDRVLSNMVGWDIGAGHRAYQRYLNKFTQATNQKVFGHLYKWFFDNLVFDNYTLDFDSTVMVRQEVEKRPNAAGKPVKQLSLFEDQSDYGRYRYSCFVTNLDLPMKVVYDSYRGRADSENRIKELKEDFSVDSFVTHNFWATEACGNFIVLAYNFFSLFRHALINSPRKGFLKTIRYEFINTPAYFSKSKEKHVLYLARSLKTRAAFLGIWCSLDHFSLPCKV